MKTFLKRFGFLAILAIMFNVEVVGQGASAFEEGSGVYAIVNDISLTEGCDTIFLGNDVINGLSNFRTDGRISAIAGEEINFVYYDMVENNTISVIWRINELNKDTTSFYTYTFLHADSCGSAAPMLSVFSQIDSTTSLILPFRIYTKFSPSELSVINSDSDELTKSGSNFSVGDNLFMNDFEIILAVPGSMTDTRLKDTITNISLYSATNDSLLYELINTNDFYPTTQPGEYYIKLEVKYSILSTELSTDYFRYIFSDTITVNSIIIANDDEFHYLNEGDVFNVLVNDSLNGNPVIFAEVILTETIPAPYGYLTLNPDGSVDIATGTPAGIYNLTYQICEISNLTNCDDATVTIVVDNTTKIDLLSSNEKLTVYPNPTADVLNISEEVEYSVYSYSGQEILKGFGKEIDVTHLSNGIYFLKTPKGTKEFIVE